MRKLGEIRRKFKPQKPATHAAQAAPETPPSLEVTNIPLQEAIGLLSFVGRRLAMDLLDPKAPAGRQAPDLARLVGQAPPFESLRERLAADSRSVHGAGAQAGLYPAPQAAGARAEFTSLIGDLVERGLSPAAYDLAVRRRLLSQLSIAQYHLAPDLFWPLAGIGAWMDLDFQYEIAYAVRRFLRTQILFFPNDATEPVFSPNVFWALISQAQASPLQIRPGRACKLAQLWRTLQAWIRKTPRPAGASPLAENAWLPAAAQSLSRSALALALQPGWAGDWDRWLAAQSFSAWQSASSDHRQKLQAVFSGTAQPGEGYPAPARPAGGGV